MTAERIIYTLAAVGASAVLYCLCLLVAGLFSPPAELYMAAPYVLYGVILMHFGLLLLRIGGDE